MRRAALLTCALLIALAFGIAVKGSRQSLVSNKWVRESNLMLPRSGACSALLPDGRVLITGGEGPDGATPTAEYFLPDGTSSFAAPMSFARSHHMCVALGDGRVM